MKKIVKDKIRNILVISLQGMGDLLLFTPFLPVLRDGFPRAKISILILTFNKSIIQDNKYINEVMTFDPKKHFFSQIMRLIFSIRKKGFDIAICAYPGGFRSAVMCFLSGAKIRCAHKYDYIKFFPFLINYKINVTEIKHAVEMNLDLMRSLSLDSSHCSVRPSIFLSDEDRNIADNFIRSASTERAKPLIGMHCTSDSLKKDKCWPVQNYKDLITRLIDDFDVRIILVGGQVETDIAWHIQKTVSSDNLINTVGRLTLKQTAAVIEKCNLFISNDSGLVHLASAVGVPVIVIFGPTDPKIYAPYGVKHEIIRKPLECSPCAWGVCGQFSRLIKENSGFRKGRFYCRRKDFECIRSITLNEVYNAAKKYMIDFRRNV